MKAPGLAIVMGGKPPKAPASEPEMEGPSEEEVSAFTELQAALESGDAATGAMALKNFLSECGY